MVSLSTVRLHNAALRSTLAGGKHTSLFIGATQGIGLGALEQLLRHVPSPTVYVVGRSSSRFAGKLAELRASNPAARITFIEGEISLIQHVDRICDQVIGGEGKLDLLFLSAGYLPATAPEYTSEGLEKALTVSYYSRMRFVIDLLPLLEKAAIPSSTSGFLPHHIDRACPRVFSVLNGGKERRLITSDLGLAHHYSFFNVVDQATTMNTLAFEHLARSHPAVTFMHLNPGHVRTNIVGNFFAPPSPSSIPTSNPASTTMVETARNAHSSTIILLAIKVFLLSALSRFIILPIFNFLSTSLEISGERRLYEITSPEYKSSLALKRDTNNVSSERKTPSSSSSPGSGLSFPCSMPGNGVYRVTEHGDTVDDQSILQKYRDQEMVEKVWKHTEGVFESVTAG